MRIDLVNIPLIVSPRFAYIGGPGNCPLTRMTSLKYPSGAISPLARLKSSSTVFPVAGAGTAGSTLADVTSKLAMSLSPKLLRVLEVIRGASIVP